MIGEHSIEDLARWTLVTGKTGKINGRKAMRLAEYVLGARSMLMVWLAEMREDFRDGEYDCTCGPGDPCPLHRLTTFLGVP